MDKSGALQNGMPEKPSVESKRSNQPGIHVMPGSGDQVLSKYTLYETRSRFYITASSSNRHRILKTDRTASESLSVFEDHAVYDAKQLDQVLRMVDDGNKSAGGLEKVLDFHGIIGFVRFTGSWYIILCTKRSVVGLLGGHYIFHCDETLMLPITSRVEKTAEETRLLHIFQQVDLTKNFYFSYSYDLTNTLQINLTRPTSYPTFNQHFMWNHHLLEPAFDLGEQHDGDNGRTRGHHKCSSWVLPFIHGFVDQAKVPLLGRTIYTTLIARRSRHHAGTRYLKRGVNEKGHVANEVETEQIVSEPLVTSFHIGNSFGNHSNYTSYVQIRGSIPLHWTQDTTNMSPRPPIEISVVDPFFSAAAKHFNDLLERYGAPIVVVNLIKGKEHVARESKLLKAYAECVAYLNQFLPPDENKKIRYIAWDMAQATKTKSQDVIGVLEDIAEESIQLTKFFHSGYANSRDEKAYQEDMQLQTGICRTNCIDCLDRTNAAQFSIGKKAFGHQLHALGVILTPDLGFDSDAIDMLIEMYHDHGDTLAWQYTGSALVNRMDTYRRTKSRQWSSHSRDLLENVRRYYTNSLLDADKQAAMDLFLGVTGEVRKHPPKRLHYQHWFDPANLEKPQSAPSIITSSDGEGKEHDGVTEPISDAPIPPYDIWVDYYKPHLLSQFQRLYTFTMNSTSKGAIRGHNGHIISPFESRVQAKNSRKSKPANSNKSKHEAKDKIHAISSGAASSTAMTQVNQAVEPLEKHPIETFVVDLLDPTLSDAKRGEYEWYAFYQTSELISSTDTVEPQDLELYYKAAEISRGTIPDQRASDQAAYERYICGPLGGEMGDVAGDKRSNMRDMTDAAPQYLLEGYVETALNMVGDGTAKEDGYVRSCSHNRQHRHE